MWRSALIGAALSLVAAGAQAGDASDVAERGGFLLGHAYRCGVEAEQLQPSAQLIHDLAAALASDEDEKSGADKVFAERFVVSAVADTAGQPVPSCATVKRELAEFERHNPSAVASGTSSPPAEMHLSEQLPGRSRAKHARATRTARQRKAAAPRIVGR